MQAVAKAIIEPVSQIELSRRHMLVGSLAAAGLAMVPKGPLWAAGGKKEECRRLRLYNTHTAEKCDVTFWEHGKYLNDGLAELNKILRDHRANEAGKMDRELLTMLTRLHGTLDSKKPFEIISGYRSSKTNAMLAGKSSGVAKKSLHMEAKAMDIRLTDVALKDLRKAALDMKVGGVGIYSASNFVHVDTGRVRQWGA